MAVFLFAMALLPQGNMAWASAAYTPPRTGLEPPGVPRSTEVLPGSRHLGRTAEGGMGYADVYGNTITDRPSRDSASQVRRPGRPVFPSKPPQERPLPDPQVQPPAWNFR